VVPFNTVKNPFCYPHKHTVKSVLCLVPSMFCRAYQISHGYLIGFHLYACSFFMATNLIIFSVMVWEVDFTTEMSGANAAEPKPF
jgi:hypothetical protein